MAKTAERDASLTGVSVQTAGAHRVEATGGRPTETRRGGCASQLVRRGRRRLEASLGAHVLVLEGSPLLGRTCTRVQH